MMGSFNLISTLQVFRCNWPISQMRKLRLSDGKPLAQGSITEQNVEATDPDAPRDLDTNASIV